MPHRNTSRRETEAEDAAQILRGLKSRVERLEKDSRGGGESIQLYRQVNDSVTITDSHTLDKSVAGEGFEWNTSEWGFAEWEDN